MVFIENSQSQPKAELQRRFTMIKIHKEHYITIQGGPKKPERHTSGNVGI